LSQKNGTLEPIYDKSVAATPMIYILSLAPKSS